MHHGLIDGVGDLVGEHTSGEARDDLGDLGEEVASGERLGSRSPPPVLPGALGLLLHLPGAPSLLALTLCSLAAQRTLSFMRQLSRRKAVEVETREPRPPSSARDLATH